MPLLTQNKGTELVLNWKCVVVYKVERMFHFYFNSLLMVFVYGQVFA